MKDFKMILHFLFGQIIGEDILTQLIQQVVHYSFETSLFDVVVCCHIILLISLCNTSIEFSDVFRMPLYYYNTILCHFIHESLVGHSGKCFNFIKLQMFH